MNEPADIGEYFSYNPDTGEFIRTRLREGHGVLGPTGYEDQHGYIMVVHGKRRIPAHRVAWFLQTGVWPEQFIDHINRNRADNRWSNLRAATPVLNSHNKNIRRDNKSGVCGVYFIERCQRWWAHIGVAGGRKTLGYFKSKDQAVEARKAAEAIYHAISINA